jgi:hypothetical protein
MFSNAGLTAAATSSGLNPGAGITGAAVSAVGDPAFSDVSRSNPNLLYINYLSSRNLVAGYPDGTFHPDSGLTRAEAATLLVKVAGLQQSSGAIPFSDLPSGYWAYGNIAAASAAGMLHGYPDGTFRPGAVLTRAEGAALFTSLIKQPNEATLPSLSDLASGNWAASAVALTLAAGMMQTSAPGQFSPNDPLTRSDLARMLGVILTENPDYDQVALSGTLKPLTGTVTLAASGSASPATVTAATPIAEGDTITTAAGSSAEIDFPDGSSLLLKDNTILTVKKMQGKSRLKTDGTAGTAIAWLEVGLTQGQLFGALASSYEKPGQLQPLSLHGLQGSAPGQAINLADVETGNSASSSLPWYQASAGEQVLVQVDMPWGDAGIEGTIWHINISLQGTTLSTADGKVQVTSNNGQLVQVTAGFQASLTSPTAAPTTPVTMTGQEISNWQSVQDWVQQTATAVQNQIDPSSNNVATAIMNAVTSSLGGTASAPGVTSGSSSSTGNAGANTGSLIAEYKFGGDGVGKDATSNGHDGTVVGDVSAGTDTQGPCGVFNGGFIQVPSSTALDLDGPFTISAWIKTDPAAQPNGNAIISKKDDDGSYSDYFLLAINDSTIQYYGQYGDTEAGNNSGLSFSLSDNWNLVTEVNDGTNMLLYVNAELLDSQTQPSTPLTAGNGNVLIGGYNQSGSSSFFRGKMTDLRIYNTALGFDEIKALYNTKS